MMSAPTEAVPDRAREREEDLSLFFWLVAELERYEGQPGAGSDTPPGAVERRVRGLRRAAVAVTARLLDEE